MLLDLPDFDSVELAHRLEVERVVELADLVVWVVDPQKYADAALHDRYLRRLVGLRRRRWWWSSTRPTCSQRDALAACRADLGRLLAADGLPGLPVLAVSARTGAGVDELRALLAGGSRAREAAVARLAADVSDRAAALDAGCGAAAAARPGAPTPSGSSARWPRRPASRPSSRPCAAPIAAAARWPPGCRGCAGSDAPARTRCAGCT